MPLRFLFPRLRDKYKNGSLALTPGINPLFYFASLMDKLSNPSGSRNAPGKNTYHILLADDDEDDRELFTEAIAKINPNLKLEVARNGMQLIQYLQKGPVPEMIFLDLNMPGKNGKECLTEIRKHSAWKKIPVVIYSTSSNKKDILETYEQGASLYLMKPTSFRDLVLVVRKAFSIDLDSDRVPPKDYVLSNAS